MNYRNYFPNISRILLYFDVSGNFGYNNPNFHFPASSTCSISGGGTSFGEEDDEEEYNLVDTHYVSLETLSESDANRLKSRSHYAQYNVSNMGVSISPDDSNYPEQLPDLR